MPILPRTRSLAVSALSYAERRLDSALQPEPVPRADGASIANQMTGGGFAGVDKGASYSVNLLRQERTDEELLRLYAISGLTARIVDIIPDYATRRPVTVMVKGKQVLEQELNDLQALKAVRRAWKMGRLIGGGYVFLATNDSAPLDEPLKRPAKIMSLTVLDGSEVKPLTYQTRIEEPRYREPEIYMVSPAGPGGGTLAGQQVHHSRLVYIPGKLSPPSKRYTTKGHDDSVVEGIWTAIAGKEGMDSARDAMVQEASMTVVSSPMLSSKSAGPQGSGHMERMSYLAKARSYMSIILLGEGETYQSIQKTWSGWKDIDQSAQTQISSLVPCPATIFWGQAPGGMSTDDKSAERSWSATVAQEAQDRLVPAMMQIAETMLPPGTSVTIEVPPIDEPTRGELAEVGTKESQADATYHALGVLTAEQIGEGRFGSGAGIEWTPDPLSEPAEKPEDLSPDLGA